MTANELRERLAALEAKLEHSIDRLETAIELTNRNNQKIQSLYDGDYQTPSLLARVISLERTNATFAKAFWVLYTAVIGTLITLIMRKL